MCIKNFSCFTDRGLPYDEGFDPLTANILFLEGAKWKFLRSKLSPCFTNGKLKGMVPLVEEVSESFLEVSLYSKIIINYITLY